MALPSGLARQVSFKKESVVGTAVVPDKTVPWVEGNGLELTIDRLVSQGAITGRTITDVDQVKAGNETYEGDLGIEAYEQSIGPLLYYALGAVNTTGSGPYVHVITPGNLTGISATFEFSRPMTDGTVQAFTHAGVKVRGLEIAITAGEIITIGLDLLGSIAAEAIDTSPTAVAFAGQATRPFTAIEVGTAELGGSPANIKSASLSIQNALSTDERRFIGSARIKEPLQNGRREITGEVTMEFESMTAYNRYKNLTYADMEIEATNGTEALNFVAHSRFDGSTPTVNGDDLLELTQPITIEGDGSDADALTITYTSDDATINT